MDAGCLGLLPGRHLIEAADLRGQRAEGMEEEMERGEWKRKGRRKVLVGGQGNWPSVSEWEKASGF